MDEAEIDKRGPADTPPTVTQSLAKDLQAELMVLLQAYDMTFNSQQRRAQETLAIAALSAGALNRSSHTRERARMERNNAYFMVRAQVPSESERAKFDHWYETHHLPLAMDTLHADKGWRFWSRSDPSVHYAMYEFKDMATLRKCLDSPGFKMLVADFDKAWPQVIRSRDQIEIVQVA